ncbi:MAG TPA: TlpA disulfide reductase family protein [Solirubrobacterales bacterium]|nr:TlpA disulfide reductase family protein [Solirubrobacterales bacterium]
MPARTRLLLALCALSAAALLGSGCGSGGNEGEGSPPPDYAKALAGAPAPLAALYKQENELLGGGRDAFEARLAQLHGFPAVVNVWASWCVPCRQEFPVLQKLSARYGKRVAFLGLNSEDSNDAAATFLREEPVPYPSYTDPDKEIAGSLDVVGYPDTAFYDKAGKLVYLKQGPYTDPSELEADVRRYAVKGASEQGA